MKPQFLTPSQLPNEAVSTQEAEETLDLGRIASALRRKAPLIFAITAAVMALAGLRARFNPPTYYSNFEILIQPPSFSNEAGVVSSIAGLPVNSNDVLNLEDQVRILLSPGVLKPVIDQIKTENLALCNFPLPADSVLVEPGQSAEDTLHQLCYQIVRQALTINVSEANNNTEASRIFQTRFSTQEPTETQRISTLISQRFLDYGLESRQRDIQQGIAFLDEKIPEIRAGVDDLQLRLEELRQRNNLITPEAKGQQLASQITNFESQYLDVLIELEETFQLHDSLQQQLTQRPQDTAVSPVLSNNARYQALVQELLRLDNEIATASTLFLDSSPDMQALQEQRQNLLALMAREGFNTEDELLIQLDGLVQRQTALENTLDTLEVEVDSLAGLDREFTNLGRELTIATENLTQLLARREALQLEAAQRELPWELITPPTLTISSVSLTRNLALGGILGLLLGIGIALALDAQKDVIYSPSDLKRVTPVPLLGLIPHTVAVDKGYDEAHLLSLFQIHGATSSENSSALANGHTPSDGMHDFKEAFRSLAANLQRIDSENPIQSLVISSADNQLADSTTAAYLAWAAAELGNRVLLIDADFRFPHLHDFLGLSNQVGFSNLLAGEANLKGIIKHSPLEPNLCVLPAGTTNTDPTRLLSASRIRQFMAKVKPHFDLIIYDTPPFSDYADGALLAGEASGMVLISHLGTVKSAQLEQTLEKLYVAKIPLVGIIAKEAAPKLSLLAV